MAEISSDSLLNGQVTVVSTLHRGEGKGDEIHNSTFETVIHMLCEAEHNTNLKVYNTNTGMASTGGNPDITEFFSKRISEGREKKYIVWGMFLITVPAIDSTEEYRETISKLSQEFTIVDHLSVDEYLVMARNPLNDSITVYDGRLPLSLDKIVVTPPRGTSWCHCNDDSSIELRTSADKLYECGANDVYLVLQTVPMHVAYFPRKPAV